ncbi:hypothetical protein Tco_0685563 [Tanacetum coccineum]
MARDANNQMYLIAWAVVDVENKNNWCWFLSLLADDLELQDGLGLTIISDSHKGLIEDVKTWLANAEHRHCCRHICKLKKQMNWHCAAFENGISESFNGKIMAARGKPIITMLEDIRVYVMQRNWNMSKQASELQDQITPSIRKRLDHLKVEQRKWQVFASGYQVAEAIMKDPNTTTYQNTS